MIMSNFAIKMLMYLTIKRKLACYWLIVLVTMTTPISSHVKDKNDMFTARGEDDFLVKGEILVFHQKPIIGY